jgi:uncharacterized protein (DUF934 family)
MLIKVVGTAQDARPERAPDSAFAVLADADPIPGAGPIQVSLKRFLAEKPALLMRDFPLAVLLQSGESPETLGDDAHALAAVILTIPYFRDGRAFSSARILRTRMGYKGEIRITGHFLKDQIAFFVRVGADVFDCRENIALADVDKALHEIRYVYQPSVDRQKTVIDLRRERG